MYSVDGREVKLVQSTVLELIAEALSVAGAGADANFTTIEEAISEAAESLADGREWALECSAGEPGEPPILMSLGAEAPEARASASMETDAAFGGAGTVRVTLHTWRP
jgi:hypothetical protein